MPEAISSVKVYKPAFSSNNIIKSTVIPESPQDKLELSNKNSNKEDKKSFLGKFGIDIAAFATGIIGIGAALKMGKINKQFNQKAVSILESVGVKTSPVKSYFEKNIANLNQIEDVLIKDKLTGLYNRRYLDEYLKIAFNKAKNDGSDLHVFMFDIDRFKMINTALGHDGGDAILKHSSDAIAKVVDEYKAQGIKMLFARYGGEEFTLVVEGVPKYKAIEAAQKIRASVNQNKDIKTHANNFAEYFKNAGNELRSRGVENLKPEEAHLLSDYDFLYNHVKTNQGFTISAGLCSLKEHSQIVDASHESVKLADLALERAKQSGRNQLSKVGHDELTEYASYKLKDALERKSSLSAEERVKLHGIIKKQMKQLKIKPEQEEKITKLKEILEMLS